MKVGIRASLATVSRYVPKTKPDPTQQQRWMTFLRNHKDVIAGMDFFAVSTIRFRLMHVRFAIDDGRRRVLHFNIAENPTARWVIQELRETFPNEPNHRFLIYDNDSVFPPAQVVGQSFPAGSGAECPGDELDEVILGQYGRPQASWLARSRSPRRFSFDAEAETHSTTSAIVRLAVITVHLPCRSGLRPVRAGSASAIPRRSRPSIRISPNRPDVS